SATVGLVGREGELIRRTSIPMLVYSLGAGAIAFVGLNGLGMNAGTVILTALIVGFGVVIVLVRRSPGKPLTSGDDEPDRSAAARTREGPRPGSRRARLPAGRPPTGPLVQRPHGPHPLVQPHVRLSIRGCSDNLRHRSTSRRCTARSPRGADVARGRLHCDNRSDLAMDPPAGDSTSLSGRPAQNFCPEYASSVVLGRKRPCAPHSEAHTGAVSLHPGACGDSANRRRAEPTQTMTTMGTIIGLRRSFEDTQRPIV